MGRVLALGLDAVEHGFLEALIHRGELPVLQQLRARSARVVLQAAHPYRSEATWTEFAAGRRAASLRYWSTVTFDPQAYRCRTIGAAPVHPFYALPDRRVIALDVPHARPSPEVRGAQIIGWGCHDPQFPRCSLPAGLLARIEARAGVHPASPIEYAGAWNQPGYLEAFGRALVEGAARRVEVIAALMEEVPDWDLLLVGLSEAHHSGHHMWHGVAWESPLSGAPSAGPAGRALVAAHRALDASIGRLLALAGPDTTVVVFSLKGMECADAEVAAPFLVPELLYRLRFGRGLLRSPPPARWPAARVPPPWILPDALTRRAFGRGAWAWAGALAGGAHDQLRAPVAGLAARRAAPSRLRSAPLAPPLDAPDPIRLDLIDHGIERWHPACWYQPYWPGLPAFVIPSFSDVHIRINLAGRERDGCVPRDGYAAACSEVEAVLRACRDAHTGRPVFGEITRMRADAPLAADGPSADLVARCIGPVDALTHPRTGRIGPFPFLRTGSHTAHGFAWCAAPGVAAQDLGERPLLDLAPTLLALLETPRPSTMEGTPIAGMLPQRWAKAG